jgi:D-serine deaminase-like pyridoxal phosphate-dependent protein
VLTPSGEPGALDLRVGDRVRLIPSHIDPTINLHDAMYAHRGGTVEAVWIVAARGKVQ